MVDAEKTGYENGYVKIVTYCMCGIHHRRSIRLDGIIAFTGTGRLKIETELVIFYVQYV